MATSWRNPVAALYRRPLYALSIVVVLLILVPVIQTVFLAITGDHQQVASALRGTDIPNLLGTTLLVTAIVTPLCGIFGVAGAWLVERTDLAWRKFWALLLVAPIAIPLFVTSYAWSGLGSVGNGFGGAIAIVAFSYYPIVFLLCSASLRNMDPSPEEAARCLGSGPGIVFWRVVMPQLRPALLGGLLIVALDTLVEFDAFVALHLSLFITNIYDQYRISFSASGAAVLSCISIVTCILVLAVEARLRGNRNYVSTTNGARRPPARYQLGGWKLPMLLLMLVFSAVAVGVPVGALVSWYHQSTPEALAAAPASTSNLAGATLTSLALGLCASLVSLLLAMPVAMLTTSRRGVVAGLLERATYLSFALPDLVAAVALAYLSSHVFGGALQGDVVVLIFAYAILFCPIAVLALRILFSQIDPKLDDVARSLGLGAVRTLLRVRLPLARPGIAAGAVLVFVFVLSDLSTTQVLLPAGLTTLGTQFWTDAHAVAFGAAAPYAAALMVIAAAATYVLMSRFAKLRDGAV